MKKLLLALLILAFPQVVYAETFEHDLESHATDGEADTYITVKGWPPTQGMRYWNTTSDVQRCLDITLTWFNCTDLGNLGPGTMLELDTVISDGSVRPQWQTDLFVDDNGGDDGTPGPWGYETIGGAIAVSTSGDTIYVNPATYTENISIPEGVRVLAEWANLDGAINLEGDDTYIGLYAQIVATGTVGLTLVGLTRDRSAHDLALKAQGLLHSNNTDLRNLNFFTLYPENTRIIS